VSGYAGIGTDAFLPEEISRPLRHQSEFIARGEYKAAPETLTNTTMSPANARKTQAPARFLFEPNRDRHR